MSTPEGKIKKKIFEYLDSREDIAYFWNQKSMGTFNPMSGFRRLGKYDRKGISDILGFMKSGHFFALEVKSLKGRASDEQLEFIDLINKIGHIAGIVKSIEDVENILSDGLRRAKRVKASYKRH